MAHTSRNRTHLDVAYSRVHAYSLLLQCFWFCDLCLKVAYLLFFLLFCKLLRTVVVLPPPAPGACNGQNCVTPRSSATDKSHKTIQAYWKSKKKWKRHENVCTYGTELSLYFSCIVNSMWIFSICLAWIPCEAHDQDAHRAALQPKSWNSQLMYNNWECSVGHEIIL